MGCRVQHRKKQLKETILSRTLLLLINALARKVYLLLNGYLLQMNAHGYKKEGIVVKLIRLCYDAEDAYSSLSPDPTSDVSRGPCKPDFYCRLFHYLNWLPILTADCSVYLIWTHWFWLPILTFDMARTAGATGRKGMLTPLWHLIPPLIYSGVRVRPFSNLYFL